MGPIAGNFFAPGLSQRSQFGYHLSKSAVVSPAASPENPPDPELQALPRPRRPWRRTTFAALALTACSALALGSCLLPQLNYTLQGGSPRPLGDLQRVELNETLANRWVQGRGELASDALAYQRPLTQGEYRLAPLVDNPRLWVEMRIPSDLDPARFVPPSSFVGRLVPLAEAGLGYEQLSELGLDANDSWLLLDGESPQGERWVIGVLLLLFGFAGFSGFGLYRLLHRPA